jgi:hypothetical protein
MPKAVGTQPTWLWNVRFEAGALSLTTIVVPCTLFVSPAAGFHALSQREQRLGGAAASLNSSVSGWESLASV